MSEDFDRHWDRGFDLRDEGNLDEAITEWREAVRLEPDHEDANAALAELLFETSQKREALSVLRNAVQLNANSAMLLSCIGFYLAKQGDGDNNRDIWLEARQSVKKAVTIEPQDAFALHLLGMIEWRLGQKRKAIDHLKASIAADPSDIAVYFSLMECQRRALHWRGLGQTIRAMENLPKSEELDRYNACVIQSWHRLRLWGNIALVALVVPFWMRRRKKGRQE